MTQNSGIKVLALSVVTCGLYQMFWFYNTAEEMKSKYQADIPTFLLFFVFSPFWLWKWAQGVEKVTKGSVSGVMAFVYIFALGPLGAMMIQNKFNELSPAPAAA